MKKLFLSILVATGLGAAIWAGVAVGGTATGEIKIGNATFGGGGTFKPDALPKKTMVPVSLKTWGDITTDDGSVPPVVDVIQIDFDRDGDIRTKGIPTCDEGQLRNLSVKDAAKVCGDALVGQGRAEALVKLEDQAPIEAGGKLQIFNGKPQGKKPTIVFHTFLDYPVPSAYVAKAVVEKSKMGKEYGKRVIVRPPSIASGQGTFTGFTANIPKKIKVPATKRAKNKRAKNRRAKTNSSRTSLLKKKKKGKGKKKTKKVPYLIGRCSDRSLIATAQLTLRDGRELRIDFNATCKQKKEPKKKKKGGKKKRR